MDGAEQTMVIDITDQQSSSTIEHHTRHELRSYWYLFAWFTAFVGCVFQVYYISFQYFVYDVVSEVSIGRSSPMVPPQVIVCVYQHFAYRNISEYRSSNTIRAILDSTYDPKELMVKYTIHKNESYQSDWFESPTINSSYLIVDKFIKRYKICYSIRLNSGLQYREALLTNGIGWPHFYSVQLNATKFGSCDLVMLYMHPADRHFYGLSNAFTENYRALTNHSLGIGDKNHVVISYSRGMRVMKGPPYRTMCLNYSDIGYESRGHCFEDCLYRLAIKEIGKVPFSIMVNQPVDLPMMSFRDDGNDTISKKLFQLEQRCSRNCTRKDCIKMEFVPKVMSSMKSDNLTIELYAPNEPGIVSIYKPKISLIDYITYVLSCIGFWFAFSPLVFLLDNDVLRKVLFGTQVQTKRTNRVSNMNTFASPLELQPMSSLTI